MSIVLDFILMLFNSFTTIVYYTAVMPVKRKYKWFNEAGLTTVLFGSAFVSYIFRHCIPIRFFSVLAVMSIAVALFFEAKVLDKIRTVAEAVIMAFIGEIFGTIVYEKIVGGNFSDISFDSPDRAFLSLVVAAIVASIVPIAILIRNKATTGELWSCALFQLGIAVSQVCMMVIAYFGDHGHSLAIVLALMVAEIPGIAISLFCIRAILAITKIRVVEKEKEFLNTKANMEYDYYRLALENSEKLSMLRHDISNTVQTAMTLIKNGDFNKGNMLLEDIDSETKSTIPVVYCDNAIINVILALKHEKMKRAGIKFKINVHNELADIPVSDRELTSVISNLLDNAMESCEKCKFEKSVSITFGNRQGFYIIRVENSCCPKSVFIPDSAENSITTKDNKEQHGYGLRVIHEICKKYDGNFRMYRDEDTVISVITFADVKQ